MRNGPVYRPVDIKMQIAAELRAMRVAAAGSPQDNLNRLPDIIQPRTISPGACRAGCQNTEVVFMGAVLPRAGTLILKAFKSSVGVVAGVFAIRQHTARGMDIPFNLDIAMDGRGNTFTTRTRHASFVNQLTLTRRSPVSSVSGASIVAFCVFNTTSAPHSMTICSMPPRMIRVCVFRL